MIPQEIKEQTGEYFSFKLHEFTCDGFPCRLVVPHHPLPGRPWIWKAEYFDAFPSFELEMLKRGYYFAFMQLDYEFGSPRSLMHWDVFYSLLTEQYGFSRYPILFGLSIGGLYIYNWAARNPEKVGCLYADNPVCDFKSCPGHIRNPSARRQPEEWQALLSCYGFSSEEEALRWPYNPVDNLDSIIHAKIPLVHAVAMDDTVVSHEENSDLLEKHCLARGGSITVFRHPGNHHPHHGVDDLPSLCDFICQSAIKDY